MLNPITTLCDPFGFIKYLWLSAKIAVCSILKPQCHYCPRVAADWSTKRPLCAYHFDEVMSCRG